MKNCIISGSQIKKVVDYKIAIIVYLFYLEDIDFYIRKLANISEDIPIYVISSNNEVIKTIKSNLDDRKNTFYIIKNNRGRDLSALLVAAKHVCVKYDYICFLHDKKAKHEYLKSDVNKWIENMWENLIYSTEYIYNVIDHMSANNVGLMTPPKPVGKYMDSLYSFPWNDNYKNVKALALILGINTEIKEEDYDNITLGSAFWCRVEALRKIFNHDWNYEDFPEEPMADDGTISHSIERIFGFAAIDMGYDIECVMTETYANWMMNVLQKKMIDTYYWLWNHLGIKNTYQLEMFENEKIQLKKIFEEKDKVFLYGAGNYGRIYLERLKYAGYKPEGFLVSDGKRKDDVYLGFRVLELNEVLKLKNFGILITTNPELQDEIAFSLEKIGFKDYIKVCIV